jgi:hypothetical protein
MQNIIEAGAAKLTPIAIRTIEDLQSGEAVNHKASLDINHITTVMMELFMTRDQVEDESEEVILLAVEELIAYRHLLEALKAPQ